MAKSSKSCGYTGHMRAMNQTNDNKMAYQSEKAKSAGMDSPNLEKHPKHKVNYPEVAAESRAAIRGKCNCSKRN